MHWHGVELAGFDFVLDISHLHHHACYSRGLNYICVQVGQVILSLPHSLSQTGMVAGIVMELLFASLAMWTVYLMTLLYLDHKNRKVGLCDAALCHTLQCAVLCHSIPCYVVPYCIVVCHTKLQISYNSVLTYYSPSTNN